MPGLSFTDRTVTVSDEDGISIRRRTEAFSWSRELYRHWTCGGACWLDHDHDDDDNDDDGNDDIKSKGSDKSMDNNKGKDNKRGNNDVSAGSFTALQHVYSSFSATAEKQNGAISASGFPDSLVNNNNSVLKKVIYSKTRMLLPNRNPVCRVLSVCIIPQLL